MEDKKFQKLVLEQLADLKTEVSKMSDRLASVESEVEKMSADMKKVRTEVDALREVSGVTTSSVASAGKAGRRGSWSQVFYG